MNFAGTQIDADVDFQVLLKKFLSFWILVFSNRDLQQGEIRWENGITWRKQTASDREALLLKDAMQLEAASHSAVEPGLRMSSSEEQKKPNTSVHKVQNPDQVPKSCTKPWSLQRLWMKT